MRGQPRTSKAIGDLRERGEHTPDATGELAGQVAVEASLVGAPRKYSWSQTPAGNSLASGAYFGGGPTNTKGRL